MRKRTSSSGPQGPGSGWGRSGAAGAPGWGWGWGWGCTGSGAPWPPLSRPPMVCKEKPLGADRLHATQSSRTAPARPGPARPSPLAVRAAGLQNPSAGACAPLACVAALGVACVVTSRRTGPAP